MPKTMTSTYQVEGDVVRDDERPCSRGREGGTEAGGDSEEMILILRCAARVVDHTEECG